MGRQVIDDELWGRIEELLPLRAQGGRPPINNRLFIEAGLFGSSAQERLGGIYRQDMVRGKRPIIVGVKQENSIEY